MRHTPVYLAMALTLGLAVPALAHDTGKGCDSHDCATDKECNSPDKCGPNHEKCGPNCPKANKGGQDNKECCDPKGGKDGKGGKNGKSCCAPGRHGAMGKHRRMGMMAGKETHWTLKFQGSQPAGNGYTMVGMEHLFGKARHSTWWNPKLGMGCYFGMNVMEPVNTRDLAYTGLIAQNTFHFGPVRLGLGVLVGGGANVDITPNVTFQNFNGFFAADPRVSLGWQVTPHFAVDVTGNYLVTTRQSAVGGPGAGLNLSYGF